MPAFYFDVSFHRYDPKTGESRISSERRVSASSFRDACATAHLMASAAGEADMDRVYTVAAIQHAGLLGERAVSGWQTHDEIAGNLTAE